MRTRPITTVATMLFASFAGPARADTIYVNPGDSIQTAIDGASSGDVIIVAPATYNEVINFLGKSITLVSSDGAAVTTIDATGFNARVVAAATSEGPNTVLDGFTITGGYAPLGAGMVNSGSSPTVKNCVFLSNNAYGTGADRGGGGMYNSSAGPTVINCQFVSNTATTNGGGMANAGTGANPPTIINCTFHGNIAGSGGGGMYNGGVDPVVRNCTFVSNSVHPLTGTGGGMGNYNGSSPQVVNCKFLGNEGGNSGGGMKNYSDSDPTVINSIFIGNTCYYGGAIDCKTSSDPVLLNCTLTGNTAFNAAGGVFISSDSHPIVTNCVVWANTGSEFYTQDTSTVTVSYSCVDGGFTGVGNIEEDPQLVDADGADNTLGTEDDDARLSSGSPAIDAANTGALPAGLFSDLDDEARVLDDDSVANTGVPASYSDLTVDIGAYEFQGLDWAAIPGDINCDGVVNFGDINPFIDCLVNGNCGCP